MHLQFLWHTQSTSLLCSHFLGWHYKRTLMLCCAALKAAKYENQLTWCNVSSSSPCTINSSSVANNTERVNFEQQILALLLVHLTHNLSCIKFAHISQQVRGLCISSSSIQALRMKPSILRQMQSWFRLKKKKTTGAAIGYNVPVANNNLGYNLRLPWGKRKERKKRNSSQFITRIASHPRNDYTAITLSKLINFCTILRNQIFRRPTVCHE